LKNFPWTQVLDSHERRKMGRGEREEGLEGKGGERRIS
jgi:hypothetical protein